MKQVSYFRAMRVLTRLVIPVDLPVSAREERLPLSGGFCSCYLPKKPLGRHVILLHGLTPNGSAEPRLIRLARALAAEGLCCWVPELAGLTRFVEEPSDVEQIVQAIKRASEHAERKVSILGFSIGGGYGLVAASDASVRDLVGHVTVMSGHHDLDSVWRHLAFLIQRLEGRIFEASDLELYGVFVQARRLLTEGTLSEGATRELDRVLTAYVEGIRLFDLRVFAQRFLSLHWRRLMIPSCSPVSSLLSPAGKLRDIRADVALLHSPRDLLVPESEARQNYAELSTRSAKHKASLLCSPLLEHVKPRMALEIHHLPQIAHSFAALF